MISARRSAAGLAGALLLVALTATPASAHTTLTSANPAKNTTVAAPTKIVLKYADPVSFPGVVILDAKGGHHESGKPAAVDNAVTEQVAGTLPPGTYQVGWRVVAPDGHPVSGTYYFAVAGNGGSVPPVAPPAATSTKPGSSKGWLWIGLAAVVLAALIGGVALLRRRH